MEIIKKLKEGLTDRRTFVRYIMKLTARLWPDRLYLKVRYWVYMGVRLDLDHPKTFNEKLQWLKLHNRRPEYTRMVDKVAVKEYVSSVVGPEYIIPTLGVWTRPEEIDFDALPDRFVLKTSHGGGNGGVVICKDKNRFDRQEAVKRLKEAMKADIYLNFREWPYKNVPRRILAEQFLSSDSQSPKDLNYCGLADFKFFCFNGKADCVMLCLERETKETKFYFFDRDWNLLRYNIRGINAPADFTLPRPAKVDEMFDLAEQLSQGLPFARVDLYNVNGQIRFGEITFYPASGMDPNLLPATDEYFGQLINLEHIRENRN